MALAGFGRGGGDVVLPFFSSFFLVFAFPHKWLGCSGTLFSRFLSVRFPYQRCGHVHTWALFLAKEIKHPIDVLCVCVFFFFFEYNSSSSTCIAVHFSLSPSIIQGLLGSAYTTHVSTLRSRFSADVTREIEGFIIWVSGEMGFAAADACAMVVRYHVLWTTGDGIHGKDLRARGDDGVSVGERGREIECWLCM